jgi:hypothetical protein
VCAAQGIFTLGIAPVLAADVGVAGDCRFAQIEVELA